VVTKHFRHLVLHALALIVPELRRKGAVLRIRNLGTRIIVLERGKTLAAHNFVKSLRRWRERLHVCAIEWANRCVVPPGTSERGKLGGRGKKKLRDALSRSFSQPRQNGGRDVGASVPSWWLSVAAPSGDAVAGLGAGKRGALGVGDRGPGVGCLKAD
jgi:hypothetical protein